MYSFDIELTQAELNNSSGNKIMKSVNSVVPSAPTGYPSSLDNAIVIETLFNDSTTYLDFPNIQPSPIMITVANSNKEISAAMTYTVPVGVEKTRTIVSKPNQLYILNQTGVIINYIIISSAEEEANFKLYPERYAVTSIANSQALTMFPFQNCYRLILIKDSGSANSTGLVVSLSNYRVISQ